MKLNACQKLPAERGSALIIILVAVALFGALSFTVSQMLREGNPKHISEEKSRIYAQEVLTYANAVRDAVKEVRISNGCTDTDISFENNLINGYEHSPVASDKCKIYNSAGGGITYVAPAEDWLDIAQSAQALYGKIYAARGICIPGIGDGATSTCASDGLDNEELILFIPYLRLEVCQQLNYLIRLTDAENDPPPQETGHGWNWAMPKFTGSYTDLVSLDQDGLMQGCFQGAAASIPPAGTYHFFQVLIPR